MATQDLAIYESDQIALIKKYKTRAESAILRSDVKHAFFQIDYMLGDGTQESRPFYFECTNDKQFNDLCDALNSGKDNVSYIGALHS